MCSSAELIVNWVLAIAELKNASRSALGMATPWKCAKLELGSEAFTYS